MTPEVAALVLESYRRHGPKFTGDSSKAILREWLRASGHEEDRYGNFKFSDADRRHFKKTVLLLQKKDSRGEWFTVRSTPLIDAAANVVKKAGEAIGESAVVEKIDSVKAKRTSKRVERAEKGKEDRAERHVREHALKVASQEMPEEFIAWLHDHASQPEFARRFIDLERQARAAVVRGIELTDEGIMSAAEPPVAPIVGDIDAEWTEEQGGVEYTVQMKHATQRASTAAVHIGKSDPSGFGMSVDPLSHGVDWGSMQLEAKGDGYLSGWITRTDSGPQAGLFMVVAQQKQRGAGGRLLDIWCRMMDAYGITQWTAEAVGDEGRAFIDAKIRAGYLTLVREHGSYLIVRCKDPRQGELALNANARRVLKKYDMVWKLDDPKYAKYRDRFEVHEIPGPGKYGVEDLERGDGASCMSLAECVWWIDQTIAQYPLQSNGGADSKKLKSLSPEIAAAAQRVYDEWTQDDEGIDEELGEGGICHLIADEVSGLLSQHGFDTASVSAQVGEQHVWVVAKASDGVYLVDIPPDVYETGGGYSWRKKPGVKFSRDHVVIERESADPEDFESFLDQ